MWLRDLKILQQTKKSDNVFVTLFELVLSNNKTRYHATVHSKEITREDFEEKYAQYRNGYLIYRGKDHNYLTRAQAEKLYDEMIKSDVKIESTETINQTKTKTDDNRAKEILPRGYIPANQEV